MGERHGGRSLRSEFHTPSVSQRPVERAQWCDSTTGLPERIGPRPCRAGGFTRLPSSRIYQSRVWLPALPVGRFLLALLLAQPIRLELAPALPGGRFYSTIVKQHPSVTSLSAATRRRKTKGPPGGRVVLLSGSDEGGRNRLEEAFAVRHCQPDASHYSKEPQFRQSLESKINT